jgi:enoyl-CoA hydratase/carnithine racemase
MPEVDVGITPGWGGTTRMARLIGRRMTKEVNLLGALYPAARAVQLGLWNRAVADERLDEEVDALALAAAPRPRARVLVGRPRRRLRRGTMRRGGMR